VELFLNLGAAALGLDHHLVNSSRECSMILRTTWRLVSGSSARYTSVMLRPSLRIILYLPNLLEVHVRSFLASRGAAPWAAAASQAACSRARIFRLVATGRPEGRRSPRGCPTYGLSFSVTYHVVFSVGLAGARISTPAPVILIVLPTRRGALSF